MHVENASVRKKTYLLLSTTIEIFSAIYAFAIVPDELLHYSTTDENQGTKILLTHYKPTPLSYRLYGPYNLVQRRESKDFDSNPYKSAPPNWCNIKKPIRNRLLQ